MLLLYIIIDPRDVIYVPDILYDHIGVQDPVNKKCLIYSGGGESNKLLIFTHIKYSDPIYIEHLNILPLYETNGISFQYERRIPTCRWEDFTEPYTCDPSSVYNIPTICEIFSNEIS